MTTWPWQQCLVGACLAFIGWCAVILVLEAKDKRRKPNIRVPKVTLWERTNRYHGVKQ